MHIYLKTENNGIVQTTFCGFIRRITDRQRKKIYLCGFKIFSKRKKKAVNKMALLFAGQKRIERLINYHAVNLAVAKQHGLIFPQFKGKYKGQSAVLVATGPTLNDYVPIKDALHIGVNTACDLDAVNLDYYFCIDFRAIKKLTKFDKFAQSDYIKFFGQHSDYASIPFDKLAKWHAPTYFIEQLKNARLFYFSQYDMSICKDIETMPLRSYNSSCVFPALDFILYAGFSKIYLVGCDCSFCGHFNGEQQEADPSNQFLKGWKIFKDYARIFHPEVEVISVNPVGLRGMFKDIYTNKEKDGYI
jgi:hypothetical protein